MAFVGQFVRPKTDKDAWSVGRAFHGETTTATRFEILLIVDSGWDYHGAIQKRGYVLAKVGDIKAVFPYVWDADRFVYDGFTTDNKP